MKKRLIVVAVFVVFVAGVVGMVISAEHYAGRTEFCGMQCHIMKPNFTTWKKDKHSQPNKETGKRVECIDCHYAPGEKPTLKAKFRGLGQLFSYLATGDKEVRRRATVNDLSCLTAECHPKEKLLGKEIDYKKFYPTEYKGTIKPFLHKTHFEKTIEGQQLRCASCHVHNDREKHFDVPKESCFLCHFRAAKENEGRAKCTVCHEIPTKAMEAKNADGDKGARKPITHEVLEKNKVACNSCHLEILTGALALKTDLCFECHHDASPELMAKIGNKKLMHEEHVSKQTARCFQCHEPIAHKKESYLDAAIKNCAACHPEPHFFTKALLVGEGGRVREVYPSLMHEFGTNCLGCHQQDGRDDKGNKVKQGSLKACSECHHKDKRYEKMTVQWSQDLDAFLAEVQGYEAEALAALEQARGVVPKKVFARVDAKVKAGQENLRVAHAGGGIHNKKFAMLLMDLALQSFEEAVWDLEEHTPKGGTE
ncbi:MAG: NapC/NirT family cytochrome c [Desulfuromonadales bacterium]